LERRNNPKPSLVQRFLNHEWLIVDMHNFSPSGKRWGLFWKDRRNGKSVHEIAEKNKISVQAVYKALNSKNSKIENLLLNTAKTNRIRVYCSSKVEGFLWGYSPSFKTDVYITYSPKIGTQVWYEHEGDCGHCEELMDCLWILKTEAEERKLTIPKNFDTPTEIALFLFETVKKKLGWNESNVKNVQRYSQRQRKWEKNDISSN
jgi:hypothetical protein